MPSVMHNPSDETEQYDEPETIVQRHGGVELPFKHHEGGTAGGGGRGVGDEAIKESNSWACTLGRAAHKSRSLETANQMNQIW
jgi:hypothetical protein